MRLFFLVIVGILAVAGCTPAAPAATNVAAGAKPDQASAGNSKTGSAAPAAAKSAAPAAKPAQPAAASSKPNPQAAPAVDGIRVTVDGQTFDIQGEVKVTRQSGNGASALYIQKNARPSALTGGNGVELEMQTRSEKDWFQDGFAATDVAVLTFTVWKGVEFSYLSTASMPNYPIKNLTLSPKSGKLAGAYEADINGSLGKIKARIEFGVPAPK